MACDAVQLMLDNCHHEGLCIQCSHDLRSLWANEKKGRSGRLGPSCHPFFTRKQTQTPQTSQKHVNEKKDMSKLHSKKKKKKKV